MRLPLLSTWCWHGPAPRGMTLLLRKQRAQARIEGREPVDSSEDDYVVVDETLTGRICGEPIHGEMKWR